MIHRYKTASVKYLQHQINLNIYKETKRRSKETFSCGYTVHFRKKCVHVL